MPKAAPKRKVWVNNELYEARKALSVFLKSNSVADGKAEEILETYDLMMRDVGDKAVVSLKAVTKVVDYVKKVMVL